MIDTFRFGKRSDAERGGRDGGTRGKSREGFSHI